MNRMNQPKASPAPIAAMLPATPPDRESLSRKKRAIPIRTAPIISQSNRVVFSPRNDLPKIATQIGPVY